MQSAISESETRSDLIVRLHPPDREVLLAKHSVPTRLEHMLRRWQDPSGALGFLPVFDLEFDLPGRVEPYFECPLFEPEFMAGVSAIVERDLRRDRAGLRPLAEDAGAQVLQMLHPEVDPRILVQVERCRRAIPGWGAFMPCRPFHDRLGSAERGVRAIATLRRDQIAEYLGRIAWPGDFRELDAILTEFVADSVSVSLDLTIEAGGPARSIGIYWETLCVHPNDAALERLCRRIETAGWTGRRARWEGLLTWIAQCGGRTGMRSLSLKLVVSGDGRPALKAYVSNFDEQAAFCGWSIGKAAGRMIALATRPARH